MFVYHLYCHFIKPSVQLSVAVNKDLTSNRQYVIRKLLFFKILEKIDFPYVLLLISKFRQILFGSECSNVNIVENTLIGKLSKATIKSPLCHNNVLKYFLFANLNQHKNSLNSA